MSKPLSLSVIGGTLGHLADRRGRRRIFSLLVLPMAIPALLFAGFPDAGHPLPVAPVRS
jgi:MFS family permease